MDAGGVVVDCGKSELDPLDPGKWGFGECVYPEVGLTVPEWAPMAGVVLTGAVLGGAKRAKRSLSPDEPNATFPGTGSSSRSISESV